MIGAVLRINVHRPANSDGGGGGGNRPPTAERAGSRPAAVPAAALLVLAAAIAAAAAAAPAALDGAYAQSSDGPVCPSADAGEDCVYHVTGAFSVRDIEARVIKVHPDTGRVYVGINPDTGSRDLNYSYLHVYDSAENGYVHIAEFPFNIGINTRVVDFEINNRTNELHVAHMWGILDPEQGFVEGRRGGNDGGDDGRARANLTTIDLDTHEVVGTVALSHAEDPVLTGNRDYWNDTDRYIVHDMAIDRVRDLAYIVVEEGPILLVNTSTTTLLTASVNMSAGSDPSEGWNPYEQGGMGSMALAVDEDTGLVHAGVRVGDKSDRNAHTWGIATLNFTGADGMPTAHYAGHGYLKLRENPSPSGGVAHCPDHDRNRWLDSGRGSTSQKTAKFVHNLAECSQSVRVEAMHLDKDDDTLFVLYENHTLWAVDLNGTGVPYNITEIHTRLGDPHPGEPETHDMLFDARRGLLYASLQDYADPRVVVIDAATRERIGVASTTSQGRNMGLDEATGRVYVAPWWAPAVYVIEAEQKTDLQKRIDAASAGDTIVVGPGIYDDTVLDIHTPLTLTSETGMPGAAKFTGYSRIEIEADNVTVRGLSFENTDCMPGFGGSLMEIRTRFGGAWPPTPPPQPPIHALTNVTIEHNSFRDTCHAAIQKEGAGDLADVRILHNTFENIGLKLPVGWTEPLDTGGENEFQIMHGAIGLSHHPGQTHVSGEISGNFINGTSAAGIRVFKADGMVISDNYVENTPASGIGLAHSPKNVLVVNNTVVDANNEPDLDYLAGIEGSGENEYWHALGSRNGPLALRINPQSNNSVPSPDAAINVWADNNALNVTVAGNTIRGSDGAFTACTGVCAFESDGIVREGHRRNVPTNGTLIGDRVLFTGNVVYADNTGSDNNGVLITSFANGTLNATGNVFPGHADAASVMIAGRVNIAGSSFGGAAAVPPASMPACPSVAAGADCTYHATAAFTAGDVSPSLVRIDSDRGVAYVASQPNVGAKDDKFVRLQAYNLTDGGLYAEARTFPVPDGTGSHSRIPAMEIDVAGRALYVVHAWNHFDSAVAEDEPYRWGVHSRGNLTRISLDTGEIAWSTMLQHTNMAGGTNNRYDLYAIELDTANDRAYVSTEGRRSHNQFDKNASPVLAVNTSDGSLYPASFDGTRNPYAYTLTPAAVANPSSIAAAGSATDGSALAYVAARAGNYTHPLWGIATVQFGSGGQFSANYTVLDFVGVTDGRDAADSDPAARSRLDNGTVETYMNYTVPRYHTYDGPYGYNNVLVRDMIRDSDNDALYVLYRSGGLYKYDLSTDTHQATGAGLPRSAALFDSPRLPGDIQDIDLDRARGILYAVSYDYERPHVYAYNAATGALLGASSLSGQLLALTVDQASGTVYASPSWTPSVYVIDPQPKTDLQAMIDAAAPNSVAVVPDGEYDDTVLVIGKPLTLTSTTGMPGPANFTGYSRIQVESDGVAIRGLNFEGTDCLPGLAYNHIGIHSPSTDPRSDITIENNRFADTCHAAIQTKGDGALEGVTIRFNEFSGIGTKITPGKSEPLDTGGEDEWVRTQGAIGLAYHPGQGQVRNADISYNDIRGTSSAGIRVFNPQDVAIVGNTVADASKAAISLAHNGPTMNATEGDEAARSDVLVRGNTILNANTELDFDYLDGVDGSGEPSYYRTIGWDGRSLLSGLNTRPHPEPPTPSAAVKVWSNLRGVSVVDNAILASGGAFVACAGTCAAESDGIVHDGPHIPQALGGIRNILLAKDGINATANRIALNWNVLTPDNERDGDADIAANNGTGVLDARYNRFAGYDPLPAQFRSADTVDYSMPARSIAGVTAAPAMPDAASGGEPRPYRIGETVTLSVEFDPPAAVGMTPAPQPFAPQAAGRAPEPSLPLAVSQDGGASKPALAAYDASASSPSDGRLAFSYTVGSGDASIGFAPGAVLALDGASLDSEPNPAAAATLPSGIVATVPDGTAPLWIDGASPRVQSVSAEPGTYRPGQTVRIVVEFTEPVAVAGGSLELPLEVGRAGAAASYAPPAGGAGGRSDVLAFAYTVQDGDESASLSYPASASLAKIGAGATVRDAAGYDADLALPAPGGAALGAGGEAVVVKPERQAVVAGVSSPNATNVAYLAGETISIAVAFTKNVTVYAASGSLPTLELETGTIDRNATYAGGNGTRTLLFSYTVAPGDRAAALDYAGPSALAPNGAAVRDAAGDDADLALPARPSALAAAGLEVGQNPNVRLESAAFVSPGAVRIAYGAALTAGASDYTDLRVGPGNATANVTGVDGSGTAVHTVRLESGYAVAGETSGYIDIAPLASLPPLPRGYLFAGADDQAVGSGAASGTAVGVRPGAPPVVIERDTFVAAVNGSGSAAIRVPGGAAPPGGITVSVDPPGAAPPAAIVLAPNTTISGAGTGMPYAEAIGVAVASGDRQAAAVGALEDIGIANASARISTAFEIGNASTDIALDRPARIVLEDQPAPARVFHMNSTGGIAEIPACGGGAEPEAWLAANRDSAPFCYAVPAGSAAVKDYTIYTYRLSVFFTVGEEPADPAPVDPVDPAPVDPVDPAPVDPVDPGANQTTTYTAIGNMTVNIVVPSTMPPPPPPPGPPAPPVAPTVQFFPGSGGGGGGGGGGGAGQLAPDGGGAVTLYAASWDCNEGTIQITVNSGIRPDVSILSSEGTIVAQRGDGPHPAGRTAYEAALPDDPIISIRAMLAEGRAVSLATEAVRTGGQCTGEAVFKAYGAPSAEQDPADRQPAEGERQQPPAAPEAERQPADRQPAEGELEPGMPEDRQPGQDDVEIPPPPPDPDEARPDAPAADEPQPPTTTPAVEPEDAAATAAEDDDTGGCLIATAAYGSEIAPQVQYLREVRDGTLLTTESGRAFMSAFGAAYYSFSPQVADLERGHPALRQAVAALAAPMLYALQVVDMAEPGSEGSVAAYGALAIALVAGMYVAAPAAGAWYAARLGRARFRGATA